MELAPHDPGSKLLRPDEPELDLYTIPSHSSWFSWDEIHETERIALKEYFDGSSISRTPKTYKEYRDFIISKYREDPSRQLTFTEVRKSLVGDVSLLHKVFNFLEKWGLINFSANLGVNGGFGIEGEERAKVKVEDGVPNGIRVAAMPNSIKPISPISAPPKAGDAGGGVVNRITLAPLASYSNVFGGLKKEEGLVCGNCGGHCETGHYKYSKGDFLICIKYFENGNYGENKLRDDFKLNEAIEKSGTNGVEWTESETLLLLESVLKHGDDWELVAQNVQTKTKFDCIAKLIDLPFGELVLGSAYRKGNPSGFSGNLISSEHFQLSSSECQETVKTKGHLHEQTDDSKQNGDILDQGPPLKRQRIASLSDASSSLIKQVAAITTMVGPHITSAAAEAAVNALCEETSCSREIFNADDDSIPNGLWSPTKNCETERVHGEDSEMKEKPTQSGKSQKRLSMAVTFYDINVVVGLKKLDDYLLAHSYITGYEASKDDLIVHAALSKPPSSEFVNVSRWYNHITALLRISGVSGQGSGVIVEGSAPITEEAVATPPVADTKASAAEDDDDDVDLFGEETEEEKKAAEERAASIKASTKKKESGKSSVLLDVKPWDDETDMKKLEEAVRSVHIEGLHWGASKLVAVGYGIKKLQIMLTIVDDLVSVDTLIEEQLTVEPINEYVQSCDIVAFNKI